MVVRYFHCFHFILLLRRTLLDHSPLSPSLPLSRTAHTPQSEASPPPLPTTSLSVSTSQPHGPHPTVISFAVAATHNLPLRLCLSGARPAPHSQRLCRRYPQPQQQNTARGLATHAATHNLPKDAAIAFSKKRQKLIQTPRNLVDEVWISRPPLELNPVAVHPPQFSGRSVADKLKDLRENLVQEKVRGILITTLDEVTKEKVMEAIERHILGEAVLMANF
ncbi:uncharacterized protein LOC113767871 [Coffea eugenioides]|uniref:uncharacterized protein LOC113767871 n=1 Tax=Coffea eugenioides TaxID=49369 RepID=UPI000F606E26|nr:uncharacterized protein LOC113767871 [Coffea eugenioides]